MHGKDRHDLRRDPNKVESAADCSGVRITDIVGEPSCHIQFYKSADCRYPVRVAAPMRHVDTLSMAHKFPTRSIWRIREPSSP